MTRFALVISIGPRDSEFARAADLFESLFTCEPAACTHVVMIDDHVPQRGLASKFTVPGSCQLVVLPNPRMGRGDGWSSGLAAGIITAHQWIAQHAQVDFSLKVDTDTLVIAPFADKIADKFRELPGVGQLGSYRFFPGKTSRYPKPNTDLAPALEKLLRQVTLWRRTTTRWPRLQIGCFGRYGRIRRIIRRALLQGYALSEHCQGGGYAISGRALRAMLEAGLLDDPLTWKYTPCGEDVVMALLVRAAGLELHDFNADGEVFGVKSLGLPDAPRRLLERGFSVIHTVKDYRQYKESQTRAFFRQVRQHPPPPITPIPSAPAVVEPDVKPARIAVMTPLGPGAQQRQRTRDLLESLFHYEPATALVVLIDDDALEPNEQARHIYPFPSTCQAVVVSNPRRGRGHWHGAGATAGTVAALDWIARHADVDAALRLDNDALVIAPLTRKLAQTLAANPNAGMLGSYRRYPSPGGHVQRRSVEWAPAFEKLARQFTVWRRPDRLFPTVQIGYAGRFGRIRRILRTALIRGYALTDSCQGGAYAVSRRAIDLIRDAGYLEDPLLWMNTPCTEDVVLSLYVRAVGLELHDCNADGEIFGVKFVGLPDTPPRLRERGYSIIHSVKDHGPHREEQTRAFFKSLRDQPDAVSNGSPR